MNKLQYRLTNSIRSLLEIQPRLRKPYQQCMAEEFTALSQSLAKVEKMELCEEDMQKLESLTEKFMQEVRYAGCFARPFKQAN